MITYFRKIFLFLVFILAAQGGLYANEKDRFDQTLLDRLYAYYESEKNHK